MSWCQESCGLFGVSIHITKGFWVGEFTRVIRIIRDARRRITRMLGARVVGVAGHTGIII